jgi:hypothetical protein
MGLPDTHWRKSSRSAEEVDCIEVALGHDAVGVRDSKNPDGGHLTLPTVAWRTFTSALRR